MCKIYNLMKQFCVKFKVKFDLKPRLLLGSLSYCTGVWAISVVQGCCFEVRQGVALDSGPMPCVLALAQWARTRVLGCRLGV